jgi:hypothetical protein
LVKGETNPRFSYDPTGVAVTGRCTIRFNNEWSHWQVRQTLLWGLAKHKYVILCETSGKRKLNNLRALRRP